MENIKDIEKIIQEECTDLITTYKNVYDNVSINIRKNKRNFKIRKFIYLCICICALFFSYIYYDKLGERWSNYFCYITYFFICKIYKKI